MNANEQLPALQELQSHPQWVCWRLEPDSKGKLTKVPYNAYGYKASADNSNTWTTYELAKNGCKLGDFNGIGYEFLKEKHITGVDLDHCIDEHGNIDEWAQTILENLHSYAEFSVSSEGIHIFVQATLPEKCRHKFFLPGMRHPKAVIEIYDSVRFFVMTLKHVPGTPDTIEPGQAGIDALYEQHDKPKNQPKEKQEPAALPINLSDSELLEKVRDSKQGVKFSALWRGDASGYGSHSEADQALCNILAFWTGKDASRIDSLFRQSGLYREEKWDRNARSGETYGEGTIRGAIEHCAEVYNPNKRSEQLERDMQDILNHIEHTQRQQSKKARKPYHITPKQVETKKVLEYLDQNELGDAYLFAEAFQGQICYDHTGKEWYLWAGHYWQVDTTSQIRILLSGVLGTIYLKASADLNIELAKVDQQLSSILAADATSEEANPLKDQYKTLKGGMSKIATRVKDLRGAGRNKRVQEFIQSLMGITSDRWDTDPWLLATPNGVIDLRTGECQEGQPGDYIRTVCPTEWESLDTPCPNFERFLQEIFGDRQEEDRNSLINFLQCYFGYGITGLTTIALFLILYGEEGRNGKDTLLGVLKGIIGPYAGAISNDVFLSQNEKGRHAGAATPHLCDLQGKRLVWGSETRQGDKLNITQIKSLTGSGDIPARQNYGKQYSFAPSHKLVLMTNYKPHADAKDKAFWQRVGLIEFNLRFVAQPQAQNERLADANLKETLKQEAAGILAWLVRGCLKWQEQEALTLPESVHMATDAYRQEEDTLHLFIDECCVENKDYKVEAGRLYSEYQQWCKNNQLSAMNGRLFGEDMRKRFEKERTNKGFIYQGIGIRSNDDPPFNPPPKKEPVYGDSQPYTNDKPASGASPDETQGKKVYSVYGESLNFSNLKKDSSPIGDFSGLPYTPYTKKDEVSSKPASGASPDSVYGQEAPYTNHTFSSVAANLEQLRKLANASGKDTIRWSVPDNDLPSGDISIEEYCRCIEQCLESSNLDTCTSAREDVAWQLEQFSMQQKGA